MRMHLLFYGSCLLFLSGCSLFIFGGAAVATGVGYTGYKVYEGGGNLVSGVKHEAGEIGSGLNVKVSETHRTIIEHMGTYKSTYDAKVNDVERSARAVLDGGGMLLYSDKLVESERILKSKTIGGDQIQVTVTPANVNQTVIKIRVNDGDTNRSEFIYDEIKKEISSGSQNKMNGAEK